MATSPSDWALSSNQSLLVKFNTRPVQHPINLYTILRVKQHTVTNVFQIHEVKNNISRPPTVYASQDATGGSGTRPNNGTQIVITYPKPSQKHNILGRFPY